MKELITSNPERIAGPTWLLAKYGTDWRSARQEITDQLGQWSAIEPIEVLSLITYLFKMVGTR